MGRLGCRRLRDALATAARQLRPHVADDAERAGHVVQHLGHVFAERTQARRRIAGRRRARRAPRSSRGKLSGSGRRAGLRRIVSVRFGRRAVVTGSPPARSRRSAPRDRPGSVQAARCAARSFSEEAPNRSRNSFASRSFSCSLRSTCSCSPSRAACSSAACAQVGGVFRLASSNRLRSAAMLRGSVAGSSGAGMARIFQYQFASRQVFSCAWRMFSSARQLRTPSPRRHAPVDAFQQHRQLRRRQRHRAFFRLRPDEAAFLEPLGEQAQTLAIPA